MKRQIVLGTVFAVAAARAAAGQIRNPVDAPVTFAQCGGRALAEYQVEQLARFRPDSALDVAPTDTASVGPAVQFVVDSAGHVIAESLYMITATPQSERDKIVAWLPLWRYTPARVGGRASCQVVQTFVRQRDHRKDPDAAT